MRVSERVIGHFGGGDDVLCCLAEVKLVIKIDVKWPLTATLISSSPHLLISSGEAGDQAI